MKDPFRLDLKNNSFFIWVLAVDADVPEMPVQFHNLIKYYAIEHYGYFESAPEVLARAEKFSKKYMRQLEANQLGRFRKARAIA